MNSQNAGGTATQAGINYQNRVAAWFAARVLAEVGAEPLEGLRTATTLEFLRCETEQPVDDLMVGTSDGGHFFIQVKRSLNLESAIESRFQGTVNQFVRQFLAYRDGNAGPRAWERPVEIERDRIVLVTSSRSPATIREILPAVLRRASSLEPDQPIDRCATTAEERRVLETLLAGLQSSWQDSRRAAPPDDDVRQVLRLLKVLVLDLEDNGVAEREAKQLLRQSVLRDVSQTDVAWSTLIEACSQLAVSRGGANREQLQQVLASHQLELNVPPSYRDDIERLRRYSAETLRSVEELSCLAVGDQNIKIQRESTQILRRAVESNSLLVVGEPGAGKSGAIHDLVKSLHDDNRDVVFFAVDRVEARGLVGLRDELGLSHELNQVLQNWPGEAPAFLVIDALDAARNDQSAQTLRTLLSETLRHEQRWRVVASIRKFDLQYDLRLKELFEGRPVSDEYKDPSFWNTRHLDIRVLNANELIEAGTQSIELLNLFRSILEEGLDDLLSLLSNPFNLRLVGDLLGSGAELGALTPIKTQMGLLERYWEERVLISRSQTQGDTRELVLRHAVEAMVAARSLRIDRSLLTDRASATDALRDLLSSHVLAEWRPSAEAQPNRYVITFGHHIFFDYAVARLLLRGTSEALVERFSAETELTVAIRPSLMLHFRYVWESDPSRSSFWELVLLLVRTQGIPEIGKLIGPTAAADLIRTVADLRPLIERLQHPEASVRNVAKEALRHVTGAVQTTQSGAKWLLVGPTARPWCDLLDEASSRIEETAYTIRPLLMRLSDLAAELTDNQKAALGRVARRLLDYAWAKPGPPDQYLIVHAIQAVCRTFDSDASESGTILRRSLDPAHLASYAHIELPWLGREVESLVEYDAQLVEEIYVAAFTHEEESVEETDVGGSRILALRSTRSQDFKEARWLLAAHYRKFLDRAPIPATRALIAAIDTYVTNRQRDDRPLSWTSETFDFNGQEAQTTTDFSDIWDSGSAYRDDDPLRMLDTFESYLRDLSSDESKSAERIAILDLIVQRNRYAVFWKRLLDLGAGEPTSLGLEIRSLAYAVPILTGFDTTRPVGDFLNKVFPLLETSERQLVERAILSIPTTASDDSELEGLQLRRDRLLWCLPPEALVTTEAMNAFEELRSRGGGPENERRGPLGGVWGGQVTDEDLLARQGVPVEAEANRRIQELIRPVQLFAANYQNAKPKASVIADLMPNMQTLYDALARADEDGVHVKQKENGDAYLIEACEKIAGSDELVKCSDDIKRFTRQILLVGSTNRSPEYHPENDRYFDENPSWGIPSPRVDATGGLMWLAREPAMADSELLRRIEQLSRDEVPAVRFQVASRLNYIYDTAPDLMWQMIERMSHEEQSRGVLEALLHVPLSVFAGPYADRIVELTRVIFERIREGSGATKIRSMCTRLFCGLYVWRDHPQARTMVFRIANAPLVYANEAHKITFELRGPLTVGYVDVPNADEDAIRGRSFELMGAILNATTERLGALRSTNGEDATTWSEEDLEQAKKLFHLADSIAQELFFASGAFDKEMGQRETSKPPLGDAERSRFLREALPLLNDLAEIGAAKVAHNLVKTLEYLLEYDPAEVFLTIGRVVQAAQRGGYQYESLAVEVIVGVVKRFLATYRYLLRERPECRQALIEILDTFVAAGWPQAFELTYQLEEIYR